MADLPPATPSPLLAPAPTVAEVQVTAPRLPPSPAMGAFSVIRLTPETLEGSPRLDEALRRVPGVELFRRTASDVANPTIQGLSLRNFAPSGAGRALVTLDGAPQNDPFGGWVIWSALPPESLAEVEIIKGAGAGPYGAGALTGVVNLTERAARDGVLGLDVSAASRGELRGVAVLGAPHLLTVVSASTRDGYVPVRGPGRGAVDEPAGLDAASVAARLQGEVAGVTAAFRLSAYQEDREGGVQGVGSETSGGSATLTLAEAAGPDAGGWRLQAWLRSSDMKNRFAAIEDDRSGGRPAAEQYATPAVGYGLNAAYRWRRGAWTWEAGGDLRIAEGETQERFRNLGAGFTRGRIAGGRTEVGGLYAEGVYDGGDRLFTGAVRVDAWAARDAVRQERDLAGGAVLLDSRAPDSDGVTPTARLGGRVRLTDAVWLRGAAYSGFRTPTLNELHRPFRVGADITEANPELEPERLYGAEFGLSGEGAVSWDATVFYSRLEDPITNVTLAQGPGTFPIAGFVPAGGSLRQRRNAGAIDAVGVELSAARSFGPISARAALAAVRAEVDGGSAAPQLTGLRPAQTPEVSATAQLGWRASERLNLSAGLRYEGERFEDDLNSRTLSPAATLDLQAAWRTTSGGEFYVAADNLFDAEVEVDEDGDGLETFAAPRTFRVGYRLRR
ncbi:MAG: TonB-dependent receptor [Phenylobacterium sp. RIFCSPHIGHO2_01_FULL_70_10]|nr:MAG: TonB-dependent receptor [Phenylobacterium sp. RIFCSPHIGHO2_01_FULL_70_10]